MCGWPSEAENPLRHCVSPMSGTPQPTRWKIVVRVLLSVPHVGGAGGIERAAYSMARALSEHKLDIAASHIRGGPFGKFPESTRVRNASNWRWRGASRKSGRLLVNPVRRHLLPDYDVAITTTWAVNIVPTVRAGAKLLMLAGAGLTDRVRDHDGVLFEAPGNTRLVPRDIPHVLIPPPYFPLAPEPDPIEIVLPEEFFLTVFNPYGPVKGADDLRRALISSPLPIVWCHSTATLDFAVDQDLLDHPKLVHIADPSPAEMRYLYETCVAYLSFSRSEGFGWAIVDGLNYSPAVVSRSVGVLTFPESHQTGVHLVGEEWEFDWDSLEERRSTAVRDLSFLSPQRFERNLLQLSRTSTASEAA